MGSLRKKTRLSPDLPGCKPAIERLDSVPHEDFPNG